MTTASWGTARRWTHRLPWPCPGCAGRPRSRWEMRPRARSSRAATSRAGETTAPASWQVRSRARRRATPPRVRPRRGPSPACDPFAGAKVAHAVTRLLVTGATGFLGAEIARQAVGAGHHVVVLHRSTSSLARIASIPVERAVGDVTDRASLDRAMRGVEVCIHAAGDTSYYLRDRKRSRAVNVDGVKNIVDAARAAGVRRIVHTSSVAAI